MARRAPGLREAYGWTPPTGIPDDRNVETFYDKALATRFAGSALQDSMLSQPVVVAVLIAMLAGKALQEMIVTPAGGRSSISALF